MHDPELREYARYLTLEFLRQKYYEVRGGGASSKGIQRNINELIRRQLGIAPFDPKFRDPVDYFLVKSVLDELRADKYVETEYGTYDYNREVRSGFFGKKTTIKEMRDYPFHRLTKSGVEFVKDLRAPPKPPQLTIISDVKGSTVIAGSKNKVSQ